MLRSHDLPLKDRVLKATSSLSVPLPLVSFNYRRDKYKHWTDGQMAKAVDAVKSRGLAVRRAAEEYDIPKSTLHDRVSGRVLAGGCSGPPKYLTDEEEELEEFLIGCASVGYARYTVPSDAAGWGGGLPQGPGNRCNAWVVGGL